MPIRIVIVEDHQAFRETLKQFLELEEELDISVVGVAGNAEEAVRLARDLSPQLILMDMAMPFVKCLEAMRSIKVKWPGTKVIAMSVFLEEQYRRAAAESGADAFVSKDVLREKLVPTIREVIGKGPGRRAT